MISQRTKPDRSLHETAKKKHSSSANLPSWMAKSLNQCGTERCQNQTVLNEFQFSTRLTDESEEEVGRLCVSEARASLLWDASKCKQGKIGKKWTLKNDIYIKEEVKGGIMQQKSSAGGHT